MNKNVYLIIPDMHFYYKNRRSRVDYEKEIFDAFSDIIRIANRYKSQGCKVFFLFLGDIVEASYQDMDKGVALNNYFVMLRDKFDGTYIVLGNHEFSKYKNNPVWTLFKSVTSKNLATMPKKSWKPKGVLQLAEVPDTLVDGDTCFYFNHHPVPVIKPSGKHKVNIGLFHKDILCKDIIEDMKVNKGLDVWDKHAVMFDELPILDGYDYLFNGHMHKVYGKWAYIDDITNKKTMLHYLASIGRPNQTEVQNNFLERNIPAVVVNDGKFERVEDNKITLTSRENAVKEMEVVLSKVEYSRKKDRERIIRELPDMQDPVSNIRAVLLSSDSLLDIFESMKDNKAPSIEASIEELKRRV